MRGISIKKYGGPEVLTIDKSLATPTPKDNEVLVKMATVGINPVDTMIREGALPGGPTPPFTPGYDGAGVVERVGRNVTNFKAGDRVFVAASPTHGSYAEYAAINKLHVGHLGDKLTFEEASGIGIPYFTAYKLLVLILKVKAGEVVLVHGASGAVGIAVTQLAKAIGLKVIGTAGTSDGLTLAKNNGADLVFNHREADYEKKIQESVPEGVDIVVEVLANVNLQRDMEIVKRHGRVGIIGSRGKANIDPILFMLKEISVTGVFSLDCEDSELVEIGSALEAGIRTGWLKPHIGKKFALADAPKAHDLQMNNPGTTGRIVLTV